MPCHETRTVNVNFSVNNIELLKKAIVKLGFVINGESDNTILLINKEKLGFNINFKTSMLESTYYTFNELTTFSNQLKRSYSEVIISEVATKQRWIAKKLSDRKFQLVKY